MQVEKRLARALEAMDQATANARMALVALCTDIVAGAEDTATAVDSQLVTLTDELRRQHNEVLGQLTDLSQAVQRTAAQVAQGVSDKASSGASSEREVAVRSLTVVDEQLGNLIARTDDEVQRVLVGQRQNLRATLQQLGALPIEPARGSAFDGTRHRSAPDVEATAIASEHDRVAALIVPGWEWADGSLISVASVRLARYVESEEALPVRQATSPSSAGDDVFDVEAEDRAVVPPLSSARAPRHKAKARVMPVEEPQVDSDEAPEAPDIGAPPVKEKRTMMDKFRPGSGGRSS